MAQNALMKLVVTLSDVQTRPLRELAKKECLPMTILAKSIILKYFTSQQTKENQIMELLGRNEQLLTGIFGAIDNSKDIVLFADLLDMPVVHGAGPLDILSSVAVLCLQGKVAMVVTHDRYGQKQFAFALPGRPMPYPGENWYMTDEEIKDYHAHQKHERETG